MAPYPPIAERGIVGDTRTPAPVSASETVGWRRAPRLDSPNVLGALLDHGRGGRCRVAVHLPVGRWARYAFDEMLISGDHAGLFAEAIGRSGERPGNFPRAVTHPAPALDRLGDGTG
ncbi:hypothetical protein [Nocardia nova]|uniref:hypothetical protein n=1 Tax=Nocardia nova TaxID=37330 RepID=UPI0034006994